MPWSRLRALRSRLLLIPLLIPLALLAGAAAPAGAATPEPEPGSQGSSEPESWSYVEYTGERSYVNFDGEGKRDRYGPDEQVAGIRCDDGGCSWYGIAVPAPLGELPPPDFEDGTATTTVSWPSAGDVCDETYEQNGTMTITATATSLVIESLEDPSGWKDCGGGSRSLYWGTETRYEGTLSGGNVCVLNGAPCPPKEIAEEDRPRGRAAAPDSSSPTRLSELPTPAETLSPLQIGLAVAATVVLVVLMALPTALLNSAVSKGADSGAAWWRAVAGRSSAPAPLQRLGARAGRLRARVAAAGKGLPLAAATVLAAAIVSAFIQPAFGFTPESWRMLLSLAIGFAVDVVLGWFVLIWLMRRLQPDAVPVFEARPATLLVVLGAVVFTRVSGFEPGIVFGLVAGVAFGTALATAARARVALVTLGWGLALAILAWIAYAVIAGSSAADDDGVLIAFVQETLSTITIAGIAALPIALVPLRGLTGHDVWLWSRWAWGGAYAAGLLAFFLVLMPMPFAWGEVHRSLWAWIGAYLLYAAVAAAAWLVITQPWRRVGSAEDAATGDAATEPARDSATEPDDADGDGAAADRDGAAVPRA